MSIEITITSQYGTLSRGRHSARRTAKGETVWAEKNGGGQLVITEPGTWQLHCSDGFSRSTRAVLTVAKDGTWKMTGDTKRFEVLRSEVAR